MAEGSGGTDELIKQESILPASRPCSSLSSTSSYPDSRVLEDSGQCCTTEEQRYLWRPSTRYIDPGYGFERQWRSSRTKVSGGDTHLGSAGTPIVTEEWKPSIRYINPGVGTWSKWKPSIRPITPNCSQTEQWRPSVRVFKLKECETEWKITGGRHHIPVFSQPEPPWRSCVGQGIPPISKWDPPFRSLSTPPARNKPLRKGAPYYLTKHPQLQLFSAQEGIAGMQSILNSATIPHVKQIRAKVDAYFKQYPPLHLFSANTLSESDVEDLATGCLCRTKQDVPEWQRDHFETSGCVIEESRSLPRKLNNTCQRDNDRNIITGKRSPLDESRPLRGKFGHLFAPAGNFNSNVIDHCFASQHETEPEIPSYSSQLFKEAYVYAQRDYKQNCSNKCYTHPSLKDYLYEVKGASSDYKR